MTGVFHLTLWYLRERQRIRADYGSVKLDTKYMLARIVSQVDDVVQARTINSEFSKWVKTASHYVFADG